MSGTRGPNTLIRQRGFSVNSSDTVIKLTLDEGEHPQDQRAYLTNLVISASATGTIRFLLNTDEWWQWTFPTGELTLVLQFNEDGWGPLADIGKQLRISNSSALTLRGCGNYYYR